MNITLEQLEMRFKRAQNGTLGWEMFAELAMTWARGAQVEIDALNEDVLLAAQTLLKLERNDRDQKREHFVIVLKRHQRAMRQASEMKAISAYHPGERSLADDFRTSRVSR